MSQQIMELQKQLKLILKQKSVTYFAIAEYLQVSEITVKRLFSTEDPSLQKLMQICEMIHLPFNVLVTMTFEKKQEAYYFTEVQEDFLANNLHLYYFFICLYDQNFESMQEIYQLPKELVFKYLRTLEKIKLVELFPNNRFKILFQHPITFRLGGALQKKLMMVKHLDYVKTFTINVGKDLNFITSGDYNLTPESYQQYTHELKDIVKKYSSIAYRERLIYPKERLRSISWMHALGEYQPDYASLMKSLDNE